MVLYDDFIFVVPHTCPCAAFNIYICFDEIPLQASEKSEVYPACFDCPAQSYTLHTWRQQGGGGSQGAAGRQEAATLQGSQACFLNIFQNTLNPPSPLPQTQLGRLKLKNPAHWRQRISRPIWIVAPIPTKSCSVGQNLPQNNFFMHGDLTPLTIKSFQI